MLENINPVWIGLLVQFIGCIIFIVRANDRATAALKSAQEAKDDLETNKKDSETRHQVLVAQIALIREQFVHKDDLQRMEDRLVEAVNNLTKRFDAFLNKGGE